MLPMRRDDDRTGIVASSWNPVDDSPEPGWRLVLVPSGAFSDDGGAKLSHVLFVTYRMTAPLLSVPFAARTTGNAASGEGESCAVVAITESVLVVGSLCLRCPDVTGLTVMV